MPIAADIYYHLYQGGNGERPPIVLIHGAGGTYLHWPAEIRRLSGYRVFTIDLPGHGKSEGRGQQTIEAYARNILNWLEVLGLYQAIFVGHSMGGAIALTLAQNHSDHVLGLGLVGTGVRLRVAPVILDNTANPQSLPAAIGAILSWAFSKKANPRLVELASQRMAETRPSVLHGDFLACDAFDITETVSKIHVPTLVICGHDDRLTPLRYSQYLAAQIANARLKVIPDAGHMVMLEQPQAVAGALSGFLAGISFQPGH